MQSNIQQFLFHDDGSGVNPQRLESHSAILETLNVGKFINLTYSDTPPVDPEPYDVWSTIITEGEPVIVKIYDPVDSTFKIPTKTLWLRALGGEVTHLTPNLVKNSINVINLSDNIENIGNFSNCIDYKNKVYYLPYMNVNGPYGLLTILDSDMLTTSYIDLMEQDITARGIVSGVIRDNMLFLLTENNHIFKFNLENQILTPVMDLSQTNLNDINFKNLVLLDSTIYCLSPVSGKIGKLDNNDNLSVITLPGTGYNDCALVNNLIYFSPSDTSQTNDTTDVFDLSTSLITSYVLTNEYYRNAKGFSKCLILNGFIYFIPYNKDNPHGIISVLNLETKELTHINLEELNFHAKNYSDVDVIDDIVYLCPDKGVHSHGLLAIVDSTLSEKKLIDLTSTFTNANGFSGMTILNNKIYLSPSVNRKGIHSNTVILDIH